jgi:hypothetical protein
MKYTEICPPDEITQRHCHTVGEWLKEHFTKEVDILALLICDSNYL